MGPRVGAKSRAGGAACTVGPTGCRPKHKGVPPSQRKRPSSTPGASRLITTPLAHASSACSGGLAVVVYLSLPIGSSIGSSSSGGRGQGRLWVFVRGASSYAWPPWTCGGRGQHWVQLVYPGPPSGVRRSCPKTWGTKMAPPSVTVLRGAKRVDAC